MSYIWNRSSAIGIITSRSENAWRLITLLCLILNKKQGEVHPESHTTEPLYVTGSWYNAWYNFIVLDPEQETRWGPPWTYLEHTYFITARLWDLRTRICERDPDYYLYVSWELGEHRSTGIATMHHFRTNRTYLTLEHTKLRTYFITARLWNLRTRICERDPDYYLYVSWELGKHRSTGKHSCPP